jgi:hypothetical protein
MNCQLRLIDEIGEENTWLNDKLQYLMRKYRYYRKKILVHLKSANIQPANTALSQREINPGDIVRVLSKSEVRGTLGRNGKIKGCSFLKNQYDFCDNKYKVFKKVNYFFDETRQRMLKSNDLFYLEGCYCDGRSAYLKPCKRNCFHYWHRNWLEKVS